MSYLEMKNSGLFAFMAAEACDAKLKADKEWENIDEKSKMAYKVMQLKDLDRIVFHCPDMCAPELNGKEVFIAERWNNASKEAVGKWEMLNETTKNYFARIDSRQERFLCNSGDCKVKFQYECELHVHLQLDHRIFDNQNEKQKEPQPQSQAVNGSCVDPSISGTLRQITELVLDK